MFTRKSTDISVKKNALMIKRNFEKDLVKVSLSEYLLKSFELKPLFSCIDVSPRNACICRKEMIMISHADDPRPEISYPLIFSVFYICLSRLFDRFYIYIYSKLLTETYKLYFFLNVKHFAYRHFIKVQKQGLMLNY